jgi:peptidoglycan/LPS O-acetylase OafA/YrhL
VAALDGLRALAAFWVFLFHAFNTHRVYGRWAVVKRGDLGVEIFFVLSGFLITTRLFALVDRPDLGLAQRWGHFLLRRSARIFPLYYATLLLLLAFGDALGFPVLPSAWPWFFAYAMNVLLFLRGGWVGAGGHFWSLCVEEQFYLAFPALVLTRARRWLAPLVLVGGALAFVLRAFVFAPIEKGGFAFALPPLHLDALGAGVATCLLAREGRVLGLSRRGFGWLGVASAAGFAVLIVAGPATPLTAAGLQTLISLATGALILALWRGGLGPVAAVLGSPPLAAFGRVTYGFYIVHAFVIAYLWKLRVPWLPPVALLRGAIALAVSLVMAALSYRLFERPILRFAHRKTPDESPLPR